MAEQAGFEIIMIKPYGGFAVFVMAEIAYMIYFFTRIHLFRPLQILVMNIFLMLRWVLNFIDITKERLPCGYIMVLSKK
jgi:hypothetical protein